MGYALCYSPCVSCGRVFGYNPLAVPSVRVNGEREPACRSCIEIANPQRVARGLPEIPIRPDAYEPVEESQL